MRKVALLLTVLVLFSLFLPPPQQAAAQIIPWEEWSDFWWNVQVESVGPTQASIEPVTGQYGFRFKFWNGGVVNSSSNIPMRYYLRIVEVDGEGWSASVSPTFVYQDWDETGNATVWVNADVDPSYIANITCQVEMQVRPGLIMPGGFTKYANITFQVRSEPQRFLYSDIENPVIDGKQDAVYHVPVTVVAAMPLALRRNRSRRVSFSAIDRTDSVPLQNRIDARSPGGATSEPITRFAPSKPL